MEKMFSSLPILRNSDPRAAVSAKEFYWNVIWRAVGRLMQEGADNANSLVSFPATTGPVPAPAAPSGDQRWMDEATPGEYRAG